MGRPSLEADLSVMRQLSPLITAILAIALLSSMDALIKGVSGVLGTWQIVWLRFVFGLVTVLPFAWPHVRRGVARASLAPNLLRGVLLVVLAACFFFALGRLQLVEAVTLVFTAPIWVTIVARVLLNEPFTARAVAAVVLGFAGVLTVYLAAPAATSGAVDMLGVAAALMAAMLYALVMVLARKQSAHDPVPVMVCLQFVACVVVAAPFGIATWQTPDATAWAAFALIGLLGTIGHLLLVSAFARAKAADLAAAEYTALFWAALYGTLFYEESLGVEHLLGAGLVIAGCAIASRAAPQRVSPSAPIAET